MLDSRDVELSWLVMIMTWKRMDHDHVRSSVLHNTREVEVYGHLYTTAKLKRKPSRGRRRRARQTNSK
jgi:hypothetical protein